MEIKTIFDKLELKKNLIIKYEEEFSKLDKQKDKLPSKLFLKQQKQLYKDFSKQMKIIEKIKV